MRMPLESAGEWEVDGEMCMTKTRPSYMLDNVEEGLKNEFKNLLSPWSSLKLKTDQLPILIYLHMQILTGIEALSLMREFAPRPGDAVRPDIVVIQTIVP